MHTVRNRIASRPSHNTPALTEIKPPAQRSKRHELARILQASAPSPAPGFMVAPAEMPAARIASSMAMPERVKPAESRPQKRRNPKGKKARKAAARKAAVGAAPKPANLRGRKQRAPVSSPAQIAIAPEPLAEVPLASPAAATSAEPIAAPVVHPVVEVAYQGLLDLCLQAEPALALMLPSRAEPLVEAARGEETNVPESPIGTADKAEPAAARVLDIASMQELLVAAPEAEVETLAAPLVAATTALQFVPAQAPALPLAVRPEPLVEMRAPTADPAPLAVASAPAPALAALADAQAMPLPRSRALMPVRRQGLIDVIAFMLRDSGRRLARWSARRHKSRTDQDALRRAELRQMALVSELEALDALRRNRG